MVQTAEYTPMDGRLCVITGANSGTGFVTALQLARAGADVVLVCRNPVSAQDAQARIRAAAPRRSVELVLADLAELDEVRRAAAEIASRHGRIHVLVNNAGGIAASRQKTSQGLDATFAGNFVGPSLLTFLLLDNIRAAAPSRIVNVTSSAHKIVTINVDELRTTGHAVAGAVYAQSKLAQLQLGYELADRLQAARITVNAVHPGNVASGFQKGFHGVLSPILRVFYRTVGITPEEGADTILYLATSPDVAETTGKYFVKRVPKQSSRRSRDVRRRKQLWQATAELLEPS